MEIGEQTITVVSVVVSQVFFKSHLPADRQMRSKHGVFTPVQDVSQNYNRVHRSLR